jgi:hypothetical protein
MFMEEAMRTLLTLGVIILTVMALLPVGANGQSQVRVPDTGFINDFIRGDTLAGGARRDSNTVYVLTRGKSYVSNAVIQNTGWTFNLKANDTTGNVPKPVVFLYPGGTGQNPPGQFVYAKGNVSVKNVVISGYFEPEPTFLLNLQGALFDFAAAGFSITLDSCVLTNTNGNHVRTQSAPKNVKITNCIFSNMGYLKKSNLGAGKAIDVRNGSVDTLLCVNNTFVNFQDRIIRHYQSTANIKYLKFDHNTVVNGMSYHGTLVLGKLGGPAVITNNLFVDHFALGADTDGTRQAEFVESGEKDAFGLPRMTWVVAVPDTANTIFYTIANNYYRVTPAGQSFFDSASYLPIIANPPLTVGSPLTYNINKRLGADSVNAFKVTTTDLINTPKLMVEFLKWYRRPFALADSGGGKTKIFSQWKPQYDYDRRGFKYFTDTMNCGYSTSAGIYTGGRGGYPVGDLNWFPARYTAWKNDPTMDVEEPREEVPVTFALAQNYPNPFNPSTQISYTLGTASKVTLQVFDVLGRQVATLVNGELRSAGKHEMQFNASGLASGVYFYRLTADQKVATMKMMLVR